MQAEEESESSGCAAFESLKSFGVLQELGQQWYHGVGRCACLSVCPPAGGFSTPGRGKAGEGSTFTHNPASAGRWTALHARTASSPSSPLPSVGALVSQPASAFPRVLLLSPVLKVCGAAAAPSREREEEALGELLWTGSTCLAGAVRIVCAQLRPSALACNFLLNSRAPRLTGVFSPSLSLKLSRLLPNRRLRN